eukprot:CAMPEP_0203759816 /NCGR_PEP_ID=MMETSP0098-20131031/13059_1 /ASSEMBLY_ACC=CAM_ASM_000208 /TAXON_ID=96639 /ORGANISM=" , Strain NY0313808BC1" /LENGTH=391 /DNA_ID=CAMNT_0050653051 /DNA_START=410 /DNA_END=1582 /DNA_ORIENTATION=-
MKQIKNANKNADKSHIQKSTSNMMKAIVFAGSIVLGASDPWTIPPGNECIWSDCTDIRSFKDNKLGPCDEVHPYWSLNTMRSRPHHCGKQLQYRYQCCKHKIVYPEGSKWTSNETVPNLEHPYLPHHYIPGKLSFNCSRNYWNISNACSDKLGHGYVNAGPKAVGVHVASTVASNWNYCPAGQALFYCMPKGSAPPVTNKNLTCTIGNSNQHDATCFDPKHPDIDVPPGNRTVTLYNMTYGTHGVLVQLEYVDELITRMNVSLQGYPYFHVDYRQDPTCNAITPNEKRVLLQNSFLPFKTWLKWTLPDRSEEYAQLSWRCNFKDKDTFHGMTIELQKLDKKYEDNPKQAIAHEEADYHGICTCQPQPAPSPTSSPSKKPTSSPSKKPTTSP